MKKLYDLVDWKIETFMPEMKDCKQFDDFVRVLCREQEVTDPEFKTLREPVFNLNLGGVIIVLGLPIVDREKSVKLRNLFDLKLFPSVSVDPLTDLVDFQFEFSPETGLSTGVAIIKFKEEEKAIKTAHSLNGILLPPKFKLTVLELGKFEGAVASYQNLEDVPVIDQVELSEHHKSKLKFEKVSFATSNPKKLALEIWDYDYYDKQFTLTSSVECSFIPNDISFSESGNLLVALMGNHFEVYGGNEYALLRKLHHKLVSSVKFSRKDKYAISYNGPADLKFGSENLIVWNILTGEKIRTFQVNSTFHFESFNFSNSENYLSGIVKSTANDMNMVCVYELPTCQLLIDPSTNERTPLNIEGVLSMAWAPRSDALFVASNKDVKSEIGIYEIPTRRRIPWMSIPFKVNQVKPSWGEHEKSIIVNMTTHHKKKSENTIQLGTLDWLKKQCYVNIMTLEESSEKSDIIVSPNGLLFVVLTPQKIGTNFLFYAIEEKNKSMVNTLLYKLTNQNMKYVCFSPFSNFVVIYNEQKIWFAEITQVKGKYEFKLIREVENKSEPNNAVWSSCGRFVTFNTKNGDLYSFSLFDFIGRQIYSQDLREVKSFIFRPFNFAKESFINQKKREEISRTVEAEAVFNNGEDRRVRGQRKHLAGLKQIEGFDRLMKYLERKQGVWESLEELRERKMGKVNESSEELVQIWRIDKEEILEELEDKN